MILYLKYCVNMINSIILCTTLTAFWGSNPYSARMAPKGTNCSECCPINVKQDISFLLYTRKNPMNGQRIQIGNGKSLLKSNIQMKSPIIIYVHGFTEQVNGKACMTVKNAYLKKGEFNVILMDWSPLAAFPWYSHAVLNTHHAGKHLAEFVHFLVMQGISIKQIHLIGFSLGAEIVGFAGKDTKHGKLPRITGLDPAFPLYMFSGKKGHLSDTDAEFVDVIHTDGGVFGFPIPLGDVDFFPNGGSPPQPGCPIQTLLKKNEIQKIVSCSHDRAWQYYAESVLNEKGFPATLCSSYDSFKSGDCGSAMDNKSEIQYLGYAAHPRVKGKFFLTTRSMSPFAPVQRRPQMNTTQTTVAKYIQRLFTE